MLGSLWAAFLPPQIGGGVPVGLGGAFEATEARSVSWAPRGQLAAPLIGAGFALLQRAGVRRVPGIWEPSVRVPPGT